MEINLIRISSSLHSSNLENKKHDENFINELNNELIDEDLIIKENASPDALFDMVFVESGGSEELFKTMMDDLKDPFVILSNGMNNSLPASLEIRTFAHNNDRLPFFFVGEMVQIVEGIKHLAKITSAYKYINHANIGIIGEPSDWLIASTVKDEDLINSFHVNPIHISMDELIEEIDKKTFVGKIPHEKELRSKWENQQILDQSLYIYSAIKRLVEKYNLKGLTIRCFDLLGRYKNTACLALSLLNEEGIVSSCEGDVPSLMTMLCLYALSNRPCFQANPSNINFQEGTLLLAHCTLPLNMTNKYSLLTHFESDLGVAVKGELPLGQVSICKISPDLSFKNDVGYLAQIIECPNLYNYCRTQIKVKLDDDGLLSFLKDDFGNHLIVSYGDIVNDFFPLLNLFKMKNLNTKKEESK